MFDQGREPNLGRLREQLGKDLSAVDDLRRPIDDQYQERAEDTVLGPATAPIHRSSLREVLDKCLVDRDRGQMLARGRIPEVENDDLLLVHAELPPVTAAYRARSDPMASPSNSDPTKPNDSSSALGSRCCQNSR